MIFLHPLPPAFLRPSFLVGKKIWKLNYHLIHIFCSDGSDSCCLLQLQPSSWVTSPHWPPWGHPVFQAQSSASSSEKVGMTESAATTQHLLTVATYCGYTRPARMRQWVSLGSGDPAQTARPTSPSLRSALLRCNWQVTLCKLTHYTFIHWDMLYMPSGTPGPPTTTLWTLWDDLSCDTVSQHVSLTREFMPLASISPFPTSSPRWPPLCTFSKHWSPCLLTPLYIFFFTFL